MSRAELHRRMAARYREKAKQIMRDAEGEANHYRARAKMEDDLAKREDAAKESK